MRTAEADQPARVGAVDRVIYDENNWAPAPLRMEFRGRSVILEGSRNEPTSTAAALTGLAILGLRMLNDAEIRTQRRPALPRNLPPNNTIDHRTGPAAGTATATTVSTFRLGSWTSSWLQPLPRRPHAMTHV
ncbi:hypothetical protein FZI85_08490 [Mycobacterium sp. CBMA293]|nr:hypothetical protein [Mycolicibacterium sp. CBMA 360]MUL57124.1 hypothetical protein [Mycolicibacterium sp. CBMA 335]MUL70164.1 hypothetical protein [Mycolicibacterium sp. CBMA 311]MUL92212.1 hypothetical protein [Mycolicibacterium sp. CBMA 230]MUM11068.1 hypothetical protein [Mycolicibacterium sp. CBMA 293]